MEEDDADDVLSDIWEFDPDMASDLQLARKKHELRERVIATCQENTDRPLNIAIVGPAGVGKSSLVNTIAASLSNNRWREYAYSGFHGDASQITVYTKSFPKCCHERDAKYSDIRLPTLIDIAGFTDEDTDKNCELLSIVFYGRLPENESLAEADACCDNLGLDGMRRRYATNNEALKVDRIVVVSSAQSRVPLNLIKCIVRAARPSGLSGRRKRTIPLFGVMTKQDKVGSVQISKETYEKHEKEFVQALGLAGSMHRFMRCRNYCDDVDNGRRVDSVIPELDVPVLKFLAQLADPAIQVHNTDESYSIPTGDDSPEPSPPDVIPRRRQTPRTDDSPVCPPRRSSARTQNHAPAPRDLQFLSFPAKLVVEAVLMFIALQVVLRPPAYMAKLRGVCTYHYRHGKGPEAVSMYEVCSNLEYGSLETSAVFIIVAYVVIRIAIKKVFDNLRRP